MDKSTKERRRVAVRKGLFQKLRAKCAKKATRQSQCEILQAAIEVSNYVNRINSFHYVTVVFLWNRLVGRHTNDKCISHYKHTWIIW